MSAFIVEDKVINQIVSHFANNDYLRHYLKELGYDDLEKLANDMFAMNCDAVNQRYGEGEAEQFRPLNFKYGYEYAKIMQVYKSLNCLLYQCSEGDVPEQELYKLLVKIKGDIADEIICNLKEYDSLKWG